ncbi:putative secreted protein [Pseudonocardia sp. Ae168_Ps1]|uniref:C40 family peptidase n=1 Tax=unclassified Pseudonocardia TaxID=2619320 RepID=UPI00094AA947|nr:MULTISPECIES: C40 family peptidase [unclassified Pseudonocardia]OLL69910.1 putative secreted protein [Pseudonocardia sp. Ae150A_Ps1]OLL70110.1 putative secreted protein [Pseudonocardia sp. Ae168_Ps1]OLL70381.1 putative secreted protein [Pseudonocardia sp. Ae263_Ps1]OLL89162.1 putative secreted protein [Pseudonocardia sp. Ae356_Ps1]
MALLLTPRPPTRRRVVGGLAGVVLLAGFGIVAVFSAMIVASEPAFDVARRPGCVATLTPPPAAAGSGQPGAGAVWSAAQRANAQVIVETGQRMQAPARAQWVALATAMQESTLNNLEGGDRDSGGLFQQRPSQGWGTREQITDPAYAAEQFYAHLLALPGWAAMPLTEAAQAVQRSAFPDAYAKWEQAAADLLGELGSAAPGESVDSLVCAPAGAPGALPGGAPAAPGVAGTVLAFAAEQLGKPYVWGATGPDTYDCSGLTMRAWQAAGVQIPRVSRDQARAGQQIPIDQAQPGDLVFWSSNGSVGAVHHVALYLGNDQIREAPTTGVPVRDRALNWEPGSYDERRVLPFVIRPGAPA